ncbi:MAG: ABC transporter permease subunit [Pseudomonadota bacterium]|nr:ABC transporter permease subunit [Pseudomonadota bacterium]
MTPANTRASTSLNLSSIVRLSRDENVRGVLVQITVLLLFFASAAWLISNVFANFAALEKTFGFEFLWTLPANYDINQTLVKYSNQDSHLRAAFVGLINTFLVAFVGILIATVLGFILGSLRLSSNWLVSRLAYIYIEFTRNVPVLLHILLWHGIIIHTLPHPRQAINFGDSIFLSNRGFYIPEPMFDSGSGPVAITFGFGLLISWLLYFYNNSRQKQTGKRLPLFWIGICATLILTWLVFLALGAPVTLNIPALQGFNYKGGIHLIPEFVALTWALAIYTSAFIAEIVRAGILAVDKGQSEAAQSLGLKQNKVVSLVVLPQALRIIIPPLTSQYLNLTKNSSLAIAIGYMDLVATLGGITLNQTGREMESMILVLLVYLAISLLISALMNWYNFRIKLTER